MEDSVPDADAGVAEADVAADLVVDAVPEVEIEFEEPASQRARKNRRVTNFTLEQPERVVLCLAQN